jgi:hypothetical protein
LLQALKPWPTVHGADQQLGVGGGGGRTLTLKGEKSFRRDPNIHEAKKRHTPGWPPGRWGRAVCVLTLAFSIDKVGLDWNANRRVILISFHAPEKQGFSRLEDSRSRYQNVTPCCEGSGRTRGR